jgi:hypothetical protein
MSEIDWWHVEDLAEAALRADVSIISGHDYGCGFRAGYAAAHAEANAKVATPYTEQETTK